ncbi:MAG: CDP-glycerol glycerophosphotransferase family protein [Parabacteroides sp.]|nr:CDP-glycerol glycerophosphotransferase family protein [Parabacteroides sp.]
MKTAWKVLIEGKFLNTLIKVIDRYIGIFARKIMSIKTPVDPNKVFFMTQESQYTCNPKYISRELEKRRPDLDIVWRCPQKGNSHLPNNVRKVKLNSYDYFYEIFSSKIIITNSFLYVGMPFSLKKDQIVIETWHGSLGIKRHDKDAIKDKWRKKALEKTGKMTTYCISNSSLENGSLSSTYWPNTPILKLGHARNDLFFNNHETDRNILRKAIFESYGIDENFKVVMYAPTFRDSKSFDFYDIDYKWLLSSLSVKFGGNWCLFLRYHPSMKALAKKKEKTDNDEIENIFDMTSYPDMQELIAVTDIAITDYSSWIYDFVLLRRPGFIFATDIDSYCNERGFYYPLEETPFSIARNNEELMQNIMMFNPESYMPKVEQFLNDKGCIEDGYASERIVDLIEGILNTKNESDINIDSSNSNQI